MIRNLAGCLVLCASVALLGSCATTQTKQDRPLAITVITASDSMTRLPGAEVFVVHSDGRLETIGTTDQFGRIVIPRRVLADGRVPALGVMVCHPVFYCGLIREPELAVREDMTIALATRVMR